MFEDAGNGYYYIKNKASSQYLDVQREYTDEGTRIIAYDYSGNNNQKFKLEKSD
ncbi:RICIN domain-containing protein [Bacillus sp. WBUNB004]|uniref:RICIN domain-containing protein n=1 Tax=Bacillus cereus TaxID=1396 RepID=UPI0010080A8A